MNASKPILRALCALTLLPLGMLPVAWANGDTTPLIDKVHNATARYIDIGVAFAEGACLGMGSTTRREATPTGTRRLLATTSRSIELPTEAE